MKIKSTNKTYKKAPVLVISSLLVMVLIGAGIYAVKFNGSFFGWTPFKANTSSVDYSPPTKEQVDSGNSVKEDNASTSPSKTPSSLDSENSSSSITKISVSIPYSDYYSTQDTSLHVTTLIGKVTSEGTCTLTLSRTGYTSVTMVAPVQAQASSSTCKGFTVPTADMASGIWNLRIDYVDGNNKGSASKDQQIN